MKVALCVGYYERGGFLTVINMLAKNLVELGINVDITARVVRDGQFLRDCLRPKIMSPTELFNKRHEYDVIHIHQTYPYTYELVKRKFTNFVLTFHGHTPIRLLPGLVGKIEGFFLVLAYKRILPKIRIITSISRHTQECLRRVYNVDSIYIPNGVDISLFRPIKGMEKTGYPVILNSTSWNKFKGVDILIDHFRYLKEYYPEAKLLLKCPPHQVIKRLLKLGFKENKDFEILPYVPYSELPVQYNSSDLYLLTSRHEGFGMPILESMACGIPVLAYHSLDDARIEHIVNSQAGKLYKTKDELIACIEEILRNYKSYREKAISYARKFDWKYIVKKYLEVYWQLT